MIGDNPAEMTEMVLKALRLAGRRAVLVTGWGGLSNADVSDDVFKIERVPYDWLFPQTAAVVHHAGVWNPSARSARRYPNRDGAFHA